MEDVATALLPFSPHQDGQHDHCPLRFSIRQRVRFAWISLAILRIGRLPARSPMLAQVPPHLIYEVYRAPGQPRPWITLHYREVRT